MIQKVKITLYKSIIGRNPKHVLIAKQLGLKKINSSIIKIDHPSIRGMINIISYMIRVENIHETK